MEVEPLARAEKTGARDVSSATCAPPACGLVQDVITASHIPSCGTGRTGCGGRARPDPIWVDLANPADPMAQLAVRLLALFGQMERTYTLERAAHARAVAAATGRRIGRLSVVDPDKLAYAAHLRDTGHSISEIVTKTGITRTTLYQHLLPRPPAQLTQAPTGELAVAGRGHRATGRVRRAAPRGRPGWPGSVLRPACVTATAVVAARPAAARLVIRQCARHDLIRRRPGPSRRAPAQRGVLRDLAR